MTDHFLHGQGGSLTLVNATACDDIHTSRNVAHLHHFSLIEAVYCSENISTHNHFSQVCFELRCPHNRSPPVCFEVCCPHNRSSPVFSEPSHSHNRSPLLHWMIGQHITMLNHNNSQIIRSRFLKKTIQDRDGLLVAWILVVPLVMQY